MAYIYEKVQKKKSMAYILYLDFIYRKEEEKIWQSCLNIVYKKKVV